MEQVWYMSVAFFVIGHLGFAVRVLWLFIRSGQRRLAMIDEYIADNSAVILFGLLCYWSVVALWLWTDATGFLGGVGESFGIVPGKLNGWTVVVAIVADAILAVVINKWGNSIGVSNLSDKISQVVPKVGKGEQPPQP